MAETFFESSIGTLIPFGSALSDTAGALVGFFDAVTDGRMWRSLGWLFLGILMIAAGITIWFKGPITSAVQTAAVARGGGGAAAVA